MYRIGFGFDAHRFSEGRHLVLGGVEIPFEHGLSGHSDADVLTHAICDALLGALGEGDIGTRFPDTDPRYKGASSLLFLSEILKLVSREGYEIENIDSVIVCEKPKIAPHVPAIKSTLSQITGLSGKALGLKATTTDRMGFTGRGEGVASYAVALIRKRSA
ncbi:MAG: 2-C-methyl-D-erythritol 2,4-cyclodiphosphate synthase [Candidatus Dadabacteria bacterium RIFCSPHIGHO2_12_FULL_53_21]|nr:MAG: 2-C-methyl-D-erythritol 2,4-cyclodiphosphate synthase [Candidatus Dadabacteria bacterium RIFCSPHIGHO2_12_FULL_53_21]